jgi:hypothetical protein
MFKTQPVIFITGHIATASSDARQWTNVDVLQHERTLNLEITPECATS